MEPFLSLRSTRRGDVNLLADRPSIVQLDAEPEWIFEGPSEILDAVERALEGFSARLGSSVLRVRFGNAVGVFSLPGVTTLEVRSGKWGEEQFDRMLSDIVRVASALPFAEGAPSPLPYDRSLAVRDDVLYHAFVYLRYILSTRAPREERLAPALAAILHEPHRQFEKTSRSVALEMACGAEMGSVPEMLAGGVFLANAAMAHVPLTRQLQGHLPRKVVERSVVLDFDTPENRFVLVFLDMALSVVRAVEKTLEQGKGSRGPTGRLAADCRAMRKVIESWCGAPLWRSVGRMTFVPVASTVLQRRTGYREVFRHFSRLRLGSRRLPLSQHAVRDLLEARDIAKLYELWTFFAVVEAMTELLGAPARADVHEVSAFQVDVRRGFSATWPNGESIVYNACFDPKMARRSYSVRLFPDITLELPNGQVHLFDAKFKLKWTDVEQTDTHREGIWKDEDLYKMHAYRDAIVKAESAWVLYPGQNFRFYATSGVTASGMDDWTSPISGVGAIPLAPATEDQRALRGVLRRILSMPSG